MSVTRNNNSTDKPKADGALILPSSLDQCCVLPDLKQVYASRKGKNKDLRSHLEIELETSREESRTLTNLRYRRHLTPVSKVCEAALIFLFWVPNGLSELPEVHFEFPFILIGKSTMAFLTSQSWGVLKSWYTGGGPEQGFRRCCTDRLN